MSSPKETIYEFGPFALDVGGRILRKDGKPLSLAPKALDTLIVLVENAGRLVTRDEFMQKLWPGVFVEEGNLTLNISLLRNALGDGKNGSRYIATVHRRGYQFVAAVREGRVGAAVAPAAEGHPQGVPLQKPISQGRALFRHAWLGTLGAFLLLSAAYVAERTFHPPHPQVLETPQLTRDGFEKSGPLLTEGSRIYFSERGDSAGAEWKLVSIPETGGEATPMRFLEGFEPLDVSPNDPEFLAWRSAPQENVHALWAVPAKGGPPRSLGGLTGLASWSPDGSHVVYQDGHDLFLARRDGADSRKLASLPGSLVDRPSWSPDGKLLRLAVGDSKGESSEFWEIHSDGTGRRRLPPHLNTPPHEWGGQWTADGAYFVFQSWDNTQSRSYLWARQEECGLFFWECGSVFRVTQGPIEYREVVSSQDGKRLFVIGVTQVDKLQRYDRRSHSFVTYPALAGIPATDVDFSRDGNWMAYIVLPEQNLWRSKVDGSERLELTAAPMIARQPHWSPDGRQIAFMGNQEGHLRAWLVSADGGPVEPLLPGSGDQGVPTWSSDGKKILFGEPLGVHPRAAMNIHTLDLQTSQLSTLPGSNGLWSARWSPDGRYVAALVLGPEDRPADSSEIRLFDFAAQKWTTLASVKPIEERGIGDPTWSRDSRYVYFPTGGDKPALCRVGIADRHVEPLVDLKDVIQNWSGVTPDGSLLVTRGFPTSEVYALEVEWP